MSMTYLLDEGGPIKFANVVSLLRGVMIAPVLLLLLSLFISHSVSPHTTTSH